MIIGKLAQVCFTGCRAFAWVLVRLTFLDLLWNPVWDVALAFGKPVGLKRLKDSPLELKPMPGSSSGKRRNFNLKNNLSWV